MLGLDRQAGSASAAGLRCRQWAPGYRGSESSRPARNPGGQGCGASRQGAAGEGGRKREAVDVAPPPARAGGAGPAPRRAAHGGGRSALPARSPRTRAAAPGAPGSLRLDPEPLGRLRVSGEEAFRAPARGTGAVGPASTLGSCRRPGERILDTRDCSVNGEFLPLGAVPTIETGSESFRAAPWPCSLPAHLSPPPTYLFPSSLCPNKKVRSRALPYSKCRFNYMVSGDWGQQGFQHEHFLEFLCQQC